MVKVSTKTSVAFVLAIILIVHTVPPEINFDNYDALINQSPSQNQTPLIQFRNSSSSSLISSNTSAFLQPHQDTIAVTTSALPTPNTLIAHDINAPFGNMNQGFFPPQAADLLRQPQTGLMQQQQQQHQHQQQQGMMHPAFQSQTPPSRSDSFTMLNYGFSNDQTPFIQ
jgi:hypothetical protein